MLLKTNGTKRGGGRVHFVVVVVVHFVVVVVAVAVVATVVVFYIRSRHTSSLSKNHYLFGGFKCLKNIIPKTWGSVQTNLL